MKIAYHPYELKYKRTYATLAPGTLRLGALVRFSFDDGLIGYGDCHPWVQLGDLPLKEQLACARNEVFTPLFERTLYFARLDAKARAEGRSLFADITTPLSHQLLACGDDIEREVADGITHFKIKCGHDRVLEITSLVNWLDRHPSVRFRLDFNAKLTRSDFLHYFECLPQDARRSLDFIEDPYPYHAKSWERDQKQLQVTFAADHCAKEALKAQGSAKVIVHKPAVEAPPHLTDPNTQLVVTTYLDHPLGQMCAAYMAGQLKAHYPTQVSLCGLLTHKCYQPDPFISRVTSQGPQLLAPEGTGFGFNEVLERITWQIL